MNPSSNKRIVYENKFRIFGLLFGCLGFVVLSLLAWHTWGLVFFGICAAGLIFYLIDPRKKIIFTGTREFKEHLQEKRNDPGIFTYNEFGFSIKIGDQIHDIQWVDIHSMFGYKLDQYVVDEICLDVFCKNDISFTITEETAGWHIFIDKIAEQFPGIEQDWTMKIMVPAFATNLTLVYEKDNLGLEEAKQRYYTNRK